MKKIKKNRVEWSVFAVSLVLVLGTLGYLVYEGARADKAAPDIGVRLGTPERRTQDFVVPVFVTNSGDETAEGVQIEVVLEGGAEPERGEFTVAFVPRRATREGWVAFRSDPRGARLTPRVLGYEKP